MNAIIYTPAQLRKRLAYWQQRLRLGDWLITAEIVRLADFANEEAEAEVWTQRPSKRAHVRILDNRDYEDGFGAPQDMEWSLVHELLHLHISGVKSDEFAYSLYEEQTIDSLAYAFVQLERGAAL